MANNDDSPFKRSNKMHRSPPPPSPAGPAHPHAPADPHAPGPLEVVSTADISKWMSSIEACLDEVCTVSSESKMNTDQKLRIHNFCRKIGNGVSQMAVQYQALKHKAIQALSTIGDLQEKQELANCLKEIKSTIKDNCTKPLPKETSSFADMVKRGPDTYLRPNHVSTIALYPKDNTKTSEETQKLVQKIISPEEMKLHVRGVRKIRNGGIIISTERKEDIDKLKQSEKLHSSGLKIEEQSKRRPRIVVIGVPTALNDKQVLEFIYEQNVDGKITDLDINSFMASVKLSHKSGKKDADTCNYILEVSAAIRKTLINQTRVYINWTSCPVRDFTLVTRCYNCQQYGHAAKFCREPKPTCAHCGELGHSINECTKKSQSPICATCLRYKKPSNHNTGDLACPAKKLAEDRYLNSVDYEFT